MKFYSDVTKQLYESERELRKAEAVAEKEKQALEEKKAEKAKRAKEIEVAFERVEQARKDANELVNTFIKDYGSFHSTIKTSKTLYPDLWSWLFDIPF